MASREQHCEDCRKALGNDFDYVHQWLDELFPRLGPKHRSARHHQGGVEQVRNMWGDKAAEAAEIHIKRDCRGRVPTEKGAQCYNFFGTYLKPPSDGRTVLTDPEDNDDEQHPGDAGEARSSNTEPG